MYVKAPSFLPSFLGRHILLIDISTFGGTEPFSFGHDYK